MSLWSMSPFFMDLDDRDKKLIVFVTFKMVLGLEHEMEGLKSSTTQTNMGYQILRADVLYL